MSAFLGELLAGEEAWTAPRLQEALERRFFVTFHPGTVRRKAPGDGVPMEEDPVRAHGEAHGGGEGEVCGRPGGRRKGGAEGVLFG
jgi:hypothetical protein